MPGTGRVLTDRIHEDVAGVLVDGIFRQGRRHWLFSRVAGGTWAFMPLSRREVRLIRHADGDAYPSVHPHVHAGEDEMSYLVEGELTGFCDDDHWTATAGSFVFVPRDHLHGFTVTNAGPARALVVTGPPHLDGQIAANGTPASGSYAILGPW